MQYAQYFIIGFGVIDYLFNLAAPLSHGTPLIFLVRQLSYFTYDARVFATSGNFGAEDCSVSCTVARRVALTGITVTRCFL